MRLSLLLIVSWAAVLVPQPAHAAEPRLDLGTQVDVYNTSASTKAIVNVGDEHYVRIAVWAGNAPWQEVPGVPYTVDIDFTELPAGVSLSALALEDGSCSCTGGGRRYTCTGTLTSQHRNASFRSSITVANDAPAGDAHITSRLHPGGRDDIYPETDDHRSRLEVRPMRRIDMEVKAPAAGGGRPGDRLSTVVTIANHGPDSTWWTLQLDDHRGFTMECDAQDSWLCRFGYQHHLDPGESRQLRLTFTLDGATIKGGLTVRVDRIDPNAANNTLAFASVITLNRDDTFTPQPPQQPAAGDLPPVAAGVAPSPANRGEPRPRRQHRWHNAFPL